MLRFRIIVCLVLFGLLWLEGASAGVTAQGSATPTAPALTIIPATVAPTASPTATPDPSIIEQYARMEFALPVIGSFSNPADAAQIEVNVRFQVLGGAGYTVPAFWMQPQQGSCNSVDCTTERIEPVGSSGWRVRFTPPQPGEWSWEAQQRSGGETRSIASGEFRVVPSKRPGFIRSVPKQRYFSRSDGVTYFPIGLNLGWSWSGTRNTIGYLEWLDTLAEQGINYARLYVDVPWFIGFGWRAPVGDANSLQADAWRLDMILERAEQRGIALQLVLTWHQGWTSYGGIPVNVPTDIARPDTSADWFANPHNVQRGGPFSTATQFFASDQGRALFRNRLRYIVARWSYSTSVFAWELIDQLDRLSTATAEVHSEWLRLMSAYLGELDPFGHPITAGVRDIARISQLDNAGLAFRQVRYFQRRPTEAPTDQVGGMLSLLSPLVADGDHPILINDFSINPWFEPTSDDPTGIHVLTTLWASALSGAAGSGAPAWWDTYLLRGRLLDMYGPLVAFTRDIPWNSPDLAPVDVALISDTPLEYQPLRIAGFNETLGSVTPDRPYRIAPDAVIPPISTASAYLYGITFNNQNSRPQQYIVTVPVDTRMTVTVAGTSNRAGAKLAILVDGKTASEISLNRNASPISVSVPLSAGEHSVLIDNLGDDYLVLGSILIDHYIAPLRTVALADRERGFFAGVVQHREYVWQNANRPKPIEAGLRISGMPAGLYRVELFDPFTGNVIGQEDALVEGGSRGDLLISLQPISRMLAVRAVRVAEPGNLPTPTVSPTPTPRIPVASPTPLLTPTNAVG